MWYSIKYCLSCCNMVKKIFFATWCGRHFLQHGAEDIFSEDFSNNRFNSALIGIYFISIAGKLSELRYGDVGKGRSTAEPGQNEWKCVDSMLSNALIVHMLCN